MGEYYLPETMLDLEGFGYGGANALTQLQTLGQHGIFKFLHDN